MLEAIDKGARLPGWFLATTYRSIDSLTGCKYQDKSPPHKVEKQSIKVPAKQTPGLRTNLQEHHVASIRHEIIKPFVSCIQQLQLYHRTPGCRRFVNACPEQFVLCLRHVESSAPRTKIQGGWTRNQWKAPGSGTLWFKICQNWRHCLAFQMPKGQHIFTTKKGRNVLPKGVLNMLESYKFWEKMFLKQQGGRVSTPYPKNIDPCPPVRANHWPWNRETRGRGVFWNLIFPDSEFWEELFFSVVGWLKIKKTWGFLSRCVWFIGGENLMDMKRDSLIHQEFLHILTLFSDPKCHPKKLLFRMPQVPEMNWNSPPSGFFSDDKAADLEDEEEQLVQKENQPVQKADKDEMKADIFFSENFVGWDFWMVEFGWYEIFPYKQTLGSFASLAFLSFLSTLSLCQTTCCQFSSVTHFCPRGSSTVDLWRGHEVVLAHCFDARGLRLRVVWTSLRTLGSLWKYIIGVGYLTVCNGHCDNSEFRGKLHKIWYINFSPTWIDIPPGNLLDNLVKHQRMHQLAASHQLMPTFTEVPDHWTSASDQMGRCSR